MSLKLTFFKRNIGWGRFCMSCGSPTKVQSSYDHYIQCTNELCATFSDRQNTEHYNIFCSELKNEDPDPVHCPSVLVDAVFKGNKSSSLDEHRIRLAHLGHTPNVRFLERAKQALHYLASRGSVEVRLHPLEDTPFTLLFNSQDDATVVMGLKDVANPIHDHLWSMFCTVFDSLDHGRAMLPMRVITTRAQARNLMKEDAVKVERYEISLTGRPDPLFTVHCTEKRPAIQAPPLSTPLDCELLAVTSSSSSAAPAPAAPMVIEATRKSTRKRKAKKM
jgi:hypothetical protein